MVQIEAIIQYVEQIAPLTYQEAYDHAGLIVGQVDHPVQGILLCLDITEAILREAKSKQCNLVIAHHPLLFRPITQLTGRTYVEQCVIQAIQQDIALYSIHTNLDNIAQGVNGNLAERLGLKNTRVLLPKKGTMYKLTTFVPQEQAAHVLQALHQAGAGHIGPYTECSFTTTGKGTFRPSKEAHPYIGTADQREEVIEHRIEVTFPVHVEKSLCQALRAAHPYETIPYDIQPLENVHPDIGAGSIGELSYELLSRYFLKYIKTKLDLPCIRHTAYLEKSIKTVAICGGAGIFLLPEAVRQQADALVTADLKYHDFFKAQGDILLADIGHYPSEIGVKDLLYTLLANQFSTTPIMKCETVTNPVYYI